MIWVARRTLCSRRQIAIWHVVNTEARLRGDVDILPCVKCRPEACSGRTICGEEISWRSKFRSSCEPAVIRRGLQGCQHKRGDFPTEVGTYLFVVIPIRSRCRRQDEWLRDGTRRLSIYTIQVIIGVCHINIQPVCRMTWNPIHCMLLYRQAIRRHARQLAARAVFT